MKTRECIRCETFFDCEGKESKKPCLHFKARAKEPETDFNSILQKEMKGYESNGSIYNTTSTNH